MRPPGKSPPRAAKRPPLKSPRRKAKRKKRRQTRPGETPAPRPAPSGAFSIAARGGPLPLPPLAPPVRVYTGAEMPFAEVTVNAAQPLRQSFTYRIPEGMSVIAGQMVYVPFGARTLQGVVMEVTETPAFAEARDITAVVDPRPFVSPQRLLLARWLSDYYLAPLFDCVALMLPPGFKRRPLVMLRPLASLEEIPHIKLTDLQASVLRRAIELGEWGSEELRGELKTSGAASAIAALIKRGFPQRS